MKWTEPGTKGVRILTCGKAKSGKTFFAGTFPKPFLIDTDQGALTLINEGIKIPYEEIPRPDETMNRSKDRPYLLVRSIINQFINGKGPLIDELNEIGYVPETLILDSLSAFSDKVEQEVVLFPPDKDSKAASKNDEMRIQDYNTVQRRILNTLEMTKYLPINFVATVGIEYTTDDKNIMWENPLMTGRKLGPQVPHYFDDVYLQWYDRKKNKYILSPFQTATFRHSGSRAHVPLDEYENATYEKFKKYYEGGRAEKKE